jgi:hypothetical protein
MTTLAQDITRIMGYEKINLSVIDIEKRINEAYVYCGMNRALDLARIAKTIRQERLITVCAWHKPNQVWWDGQEWRDYSMAEPTTYDGEMSYSLLGGHSIPPGIQTHGMCPECYEKEMSEVKILLEQGKIIKELENDLRSQ